MLWSGAEHSVPLECLLERFGGVSRTLWTGPWSCPPQRTVSLSARNVNISYFAFSVQIIIHKAIIDISINDRSISIDPFTLCDRGVNQTIYDQWKLQCQDDKLQSDKMQTRTMSDVDILTYVTNRYSCFSLRERRVTMYSSSLRAYNDLHWEMFKIISVDILPNPYSH